VNPTSFKKLFNDILWPTWTGTDSDGKLSEAQFVSPCGMLTWLSDHILELKVDKELGAPPNLASDATGWFEHFDYDDDGLLSLNEVLRGIAKTTDLSSWASPETPRRSARGEGVLKLKDVIESLWDTSTWSEGMPLKSFVGPDGFAANILKLLPQATLQTSSEVRRSRVDEALAKARLADLHERESCRQARKSRELYKPLLTGDGIDALLGEMDYFLQLMTPTSAGQMQILSEPSDASSPAIPANADVLQQIGLRTAGIGGA
jgi:hypothetical protein